MEERDNLVKEEYSNYPIILAEYNPNWIIIYESEKRKILNVVGDMVDQIFHFGSTSIPGMMSKPTVDILVMVKADTNLDFFCECMINSDYVCIKHPDRNKKRKNCMNFIIPYKLDGIDQYKCYIHIRENNVPYPEVLFAKYLRENKEIANQYLELKKQLVSKYKYDRQGYMIAKSEFIEKYTKIAINMYS